MSDDVLSPDVFLQGIVVLHYRGIVSHLG